MKNKYSIFWVNCDCSSYAAAFLSRTVGHGRFLKCKQCRKSLGDTSLEFLGEIVAKGDFDAMDVYRHGGL